MCPSYESYERKQGRSFDRPCFRTFLNFADSTVFYVWTFVLRACPDRGPLCDRPPGLAALRLAPGANSRSPHSRLVVGSTTSG